MPKKKQKLAIPPIPNATYRLQFNADFTFRDALAIVPYLHELGISHLYASPIFKARAGSTHGYDITDPRMFNPVIGSDEDFDALSAALTERGMGLILDVVPNHMGVGEASNVWWMDVLENGPSSQYADYFDVDWHPVKRELENKILLPVLEDQYGIALEDGKLRLAYEDGAFFVYHYELKLPIAPRSYRLILNMVLEYALATLANTSPFVLELQSILTALSYLPSRNERDPAKLAERVREKEIIKRRLQAAYESHPDIQAALDRAITTFNGNRGTPHSFDHLDALLTAQSYRLAFWRVAAEEINYRRFFDINDLAAIRVEHPDVFTATHQFIFQLLHDGKVHGLRIDHPDGLWNPPEYFAQLQHAYAANRDDTAKTTQPLYVVAEKILSEQEVLPTNWAVAGTTGYDFLNALNGLFVEKRHHKQFDKIYANFVGVHLELPDLINTSKKMIMRRALVSEMTALSHRLQRITEKNRRYRDFTLYGLTTALREVIACMEIYRTYITHDRFVSQRDLFYVESAVNEAKQRNPEIVGAIFDFIGETLLLRNLGQFHEADRADVVDFVMKFQQLTGPVMAKSVEDTAFYIFNRLASLNEVGGHPDEFGGSLNAFHTHNRSIVRDWQHTMLTTSTHDTKRSEDVRARINVLSEMPDDWRTMLRRWSKINEPYKTIVDDEPAPDRNDEYLFYQTLLGTLPHGTLNSEQFAQYRERIAAYMLKAAKEAKVHTSWINTHEAYDAAIHTFVQRVLDRQRNRAFMYDFAKFQQRIDFYGVFNGLAQVVLKLTSPGVPDTYQGNELWDFSLVDPDNRRAVNYVQRQELLTNLLATKNRLALAQELLETRNDGRMKLYITATILGFRRTHAALFNDGDYLPLKAQNGCDRYVCAFARTLDDAAFVVVTPRLIVGLTDGIEQPPIGSEVWNDTWLPVPPAARYRDIFTDVVFEPEASDDGTRLTLATVLSDFPVAVLVAEQ